MTTRRPASWPLFAAGALLIAALVWVHGLGWPNQAEITVQVLGLAVFLVLTLAWLRLTIPAWLSEEQDDGAWRNRVWEIPASALEADAADLEAGAAPEWPVAAAQREPSSVINGRVLD